MKHIQRRKQLRLNHQLMSTAFFKPTINYYISLYISMHFYNISLTLCLPVCAFLSVYLSTCLCMSLSFSLSLFISSFFLLHRSSSTIISICFSFHQSIFSSINHSSLSMSAESVKLSFLSVCLSVYLSTLCFGFG